MEFVVSAGDSSSESLARRLGGGAACSVEVVGEVAVVVAVVAAVDGEDGLLSPQAVSAAPMTIIVKAKRRMRHT